MFALGVSAQVSPPPASQAEVNAGVVPNKYVSPLTLAGGVNSVILYVSPSGNDSTAVRNDGSHPWKKIEVASAAAKVGDWIYVTAGAYNVSNRITVPAFGGIFGAGNNQSMLTNWCYLTNGDVCITPNTNSLISDLYIRDGHKGSFVYQGGIGCKSYSTVPVNATIRRVFLDGASDGFYWNNAVNDAPSVLVEDCRVESAWDCSVIETIVAGQFSPGSYTYKDCHFVGNLAVAYGAQSSYGSYNGAAGSTVAWIRGSIYMTNNGGATGIPLHGGNAVNTNIVDGTILYSVKSGVRQNDGSFDAGLGDSIVSIYGPFNYTGLAGTETVYPWVNLVPNSVVANGIATLSHGTNKVATVWANATNILSLTYYSIDSSQAVVGVTNITANVSFFIKSENPNDTNKVFWQIVKP